MDNYVTLRNPLCVWYNYRLNRIGKRVLVYVIIKNNI